jgi:hypothetical protein
MKCSVPLLDRPVVHVHFNGLAADAMDIVLSNRLVTRLPAATEVTASVSRGKISAVNFGLRRTLEQQQDAFVCVDNDISFDRFAIRRLLEAFLASGWRGATAVKRPLLDKRSTPFQRLYAHAFLINDVTYTFHLRPTGSLYCIAPDVLPSFPDPSNEGDILERAVIPFSGVRVYSGFAQTFDQEVRRRARLIKASDAIQFVRPTHDLECLERDWRRHHNRFMIVRTRRFEASMRLYCDVLAAATRES